MRKRTPKSVVCKLCGKKGASVRRFARTYGEGNDILVIRNIPSIRCPHCHEGYVTADTLHEIERIKLHRKTVAVKRPVAVAEFAATSA